MASLFSKALRRPQTLFVQNQWIWRTPAIRAASTVESDPKARPAKREAEEEGIREQLESLEIGSKFTPEQDAARAARQAARREAKEARMREKLDPNYQAEQEALRAAREQAKADADAERLRAKLESIGIPEAPFFMGQKEVYLPNIRIALLKTPQHPPSFAKFLVPLTWNKLDLRDYLWNVYGVHAVRVRVYVQLQRVRMDKPREKYPAARRWFRPQSKKFMTIEMDEPFYWPPDPEDFVEWDKDTFDAANKTKIKERDSRMPIGAMEKPAGAADLRALAKKFVTGSEKWTPPTDPFGLDRHLKK